MYIERESERDRQSERARESGRRELVRTHFCNAHCHSATASVQSKGCLRAVGWWQAPARLLSLSYSDSAPLTLLLVSGLLQSKGCSGGAACALLMLLSCCFFSSRPVPPLLVLLLTLLLVLLLLLLSSCCASVLFLLGTVAVYMPWHLCPECLDSTLFVFILLYNT